MLGQVSDDLVHAESALMVLPSGEDAQGAELGTEGFFDRPMAALAMRLGWSEDEVGFLWAVVALRVHPRMMVHARSLDETAPRGMSVSLYARMVDLDGEAACHLGLRLLPGHSALRNGLLLPVRGEWVVAAQPGLPSTELIHYLAGFGGTAPGLEVIVAPEHVVLDAEQERTVAQLRSILETPAPFVRYVEGGELTGRRTAVALAPGAPALAIDLAQLPPDPASLDAALAALRREAALRGVVPVIAGCEELVSAEGGKDARMRVLAQHLDLTDRPIVLVTTWRGLDLGCQLPSVRVSWSAPDIETRSELWRLLAGPSHEGDRQRHGHRQHRDRLGHALARRRPQAVRALRDRQHGHQQEDDPRRAQGSRRRPRQGRHQVVRGRLDRTAGDRQRQGHDEEGRRLGCGRRCRLQLQGRSALAVTAQQQARRIQPLLGPRRRRRHPVAQRRGSEQGRTSGRGSTSITSSG